MPELPDIQIYIDALVDRIVGVELASVRLVSPFLLRSVAPPIAATHGRTVREVRRIVKRIVVGLDGEYFLVLHLMIGGRLKWLKNDAKVPKKLGLAAFDFANGTLLLTEAGSNQTEGRLLRNKALSRLLKSDWPRSVEELEEKRRRL